MDNPIPSAMVYFDEKERKAILCIDETLPPPAVVSACGNSSDEHGFHTHTWTPLGRVNESAFMTDDRRLKTLAAGFVRDMMRAVIAIRDDFDRMRHEREITLKANQRLRDTVRELVGGLDGTICHIESEEKRLEVAGLVVRHGELNLTNNEMDGEAS